MHKFLVPLGWVMTVLKYVIMGAARGKNEMSNPAVNYNCGTLTHYKFIHSVGGHNYLYYRYKFKIKLGQNEKLKIGVLSERNSFGQTDLIWREIPSWNLKDKFKTPDRGFHNLQQNSEWVLNFDWLIFDWDIGFCLESPNKLELVLDKNRVIKLFE